MNKMKILLLGEYSNVHATLADGLRQLGHKVTVVSNGDFWKNYPRDYSLVRRPGKLGGAMLTLKLLGLLPKLRGYDVVQLINPLFVELAAERILPLYRYLRRNNGKMVLGAFGMDWYWVSTCVERKPLRYSDFNIGDTLRTNKDALKERRDWLGTPKGRLNQLIANDCDGIVAGLYEYLVCYKAALPQKTTFIPFPIRQKPFPISQKPDSQPSASTPSQPSDGKLRLFIGINKERSEYKGTDIMLRAAREIVARYPEKVELRVAESVPFNEYVSMMEGSDAILDQLYSYTPSMNPLEAMSRGIICVGGGEEESYRIIGEKELRPIINVQPSFDSVVNELGQLVRHPERIPLLKWQSREYIRRHHDYLKVAAQYEKFYNSL